MVSVVLSILDPQEVLALYTMCGWNGEGQRTIQRIELAMKNSLFVFSCRNAHGQLIGFARVVGDGVFVAQVVDVMMDPSHRRQGVALALIGAIQESGVPACMLVDGSGVPELYERQGFVPAPSEKILYWSQTVDTTEFDSAVATV